MTTRADGPEPDRKSPGGLIDEQALEITRLRERLERVERERDRLQRENAQLRKDVEAARRAGARQAAPFSKGAPKAQPRRSGRKAGAAYGRAAQRPLPAEVDETYDALVPRGCPKCAGEIIETRVATQYQEELPPMRPLVRAFRVHIGHCRQCGHRVQGRHPLQTSDALGAAAAQLGPRAIGTAAVLNKQAGVPLARISAFFQQQFTLRITAGGLAQAFHRTAQHAQPTYDALVAAVRQSPVVSPDETGWKVGGHLQWLWTFATPTTTVYAIQPGRGFDEAAAVLGAAFAGVLVRDGWAPYRQFEQAAHQTCLAHLLRRCRLIAADHPRTTFAPDVQAILQQALVLRDRHAAGTVSAHGVAVARGHLMTRLADRLDRPGTVPAVHRFARHLDREFPAIWSFLFDPTIDATNWRAEQALRPAVVTRKVCGGNRTPHGAHTQAVLTSVLRTSSQRHLDPVAIFTGLLTHPTPYVAPALLAPS